jgi:Kef-type K+ transport system membrane component KefB
VYQFAISSLLGLIAALGLHKIATTTHHASQYKLALVIGTLMVAIGLAYELKLSMLFVPLVVGVAVKSLEQDIIVSDLAFGAAFELFFIILFVFAGAGLHLGELIEFTPVVLALVLARSLAKTLGVAAMSAALRRPLRVGISSGLLLIPMAGLAIGLVQTSGHLFPPYASSIAAIVLGAVTAFETIGPPIAVYAFRLAGESAGVNEHSNNAVKTETHA